MNYDQVLETIEQISTPILQERGMELVDRTLQHEGGRWVLRLKIDYLSVTPSLQTGVTVGECAQVSHALGHLLDVEVTLPVGYVLEVSSPGLNRPLRRRADFERYAGAEIDLRTDEPQEGRRNYHGRLEGTTGEHVVISVEGRHYCIGFANIAKAQVRCTPALQKGQSSGNNRTRTKNTEA